MRKLHAKMIWIIMLIASMLWFSYCFASTEVSLSTGNSRANSLNITTPAGTRQTFFIKLKNIINQPVIAKINFVDGTITNDEYAYKACKSENEETLFGQYVSRNDTGYILAPDETTIITWYIKFPIGTSWTIEWCITNYAVQNWDGAMFGILSRVANFITVTVTPNMADDGLTGGISPWGWNTLWWIIWWVKALLIFWWPAPFNFTPQYDVPLSTGIISNPVTITGISMPVAISINTWYFRINGTGTRLTTGSISSGNTVEILLTSSTAYNTTTSATLNINNKTGTFSITTIQKPSWWNWWWGWGWWGGGWWPEPTPSEPIPECLGMHSAASDGSLMCQKPEDTPYVPATTETPWCDIANSVYTTELNQAYSYACELGITTIPNIMKADMDGPMLRKYLAKMISVFAVKIVWLLPDNTRKCTYDDVSEENKELQYYMKLSCALGLMGLNADGTPDHIFNPNQPVTRAIFWTVFSRLLFRDTYNVKNEEEVHTQPDYWYRNHLNALKHNKIMNVINTPLMIELRGWVMLMMMRADKNWVIQTRNAATKAMLDGLQGITK